MEDSPQINSASVLLDDEQLFESSNFVIKSKPAPAVAAPAKPLAPPARPMSSQFSPRPKPLTESRGGPKPIPRVVGDPSVFRARRDQNRQHRVAPEGKFPVRSVLATRPGNPSLPATGPNVLANQGFRAAGIATQQPTAQAANAREQSLADAVIERASLTADDALRRRLHAMLDSYVHGVRTKDELIERMQRSVKIGGMGIEDRKVSEVVAALDQEVNARKISIPTEPGAIAPPLPPPITSAPSPSSSVEDGKRAIAERQRSVFRMRRDLTPKTPQRVAPEGMFPVRSVLATRPGNPSLPVTGPAASQAENFAPPSPPTPAYGIMAESAKRPRVVAHDPSRPTVTDVRKPVAVMGPLDELRGMDVVEWRRLGASPQDAAEEIQEKLNVLAQDSFSEKLKGIDAWQKSPMHLLYLAIGRESLVTGKTIADIIAQRHAQQQPFLTEEEFHAIADLNQSLRF